MSAADQHVEFDGLDHVEFYVGNAALCVHFFEQALGFRRTAYAGLETGVRDRVSYVVEHGTARFVVTAPLTDRGPVSEHVARHGDGVASIALAVSDCEVARGRALGCGAVEAEAPSTIEDGRGEVNLASIRCYGDTVHRLIERNSYSGPFLPGFEQCAPQGEEVDLFEGVDHIVGNVELGQLERWVAFYEDVFGFTELNAFSDEDVTTEYSALMSKVMGDGEGRVKLPLNEPAQGKRRSQIEEFLDYYGGPGVQHIALETSDIITAVARLRDHGVGFLETPQSYYDELSDRIDGLEHPVESLAELGILADSDDEGHLLQVFTRPLGDRPTLFLELIERHGSNGFGAGNFKALFEAIEREQERRGNL